MRATASSQTADGAIPTARDAPWMIGVEIGVAVLDAQLPTSVRTPAPKIDVGWFGGWIPSDVTGCAGEVVAGCNVNEMTDYIVVIIGLIDAPRCGARAVAK